MPDWRRILVGDAFKVRKHPRYYVDIALFFPMLVAGVGVVVSVSAWPPSTWNLRGLALGLLGLGLCLLLAKERWLLVGMIFAYPAIMAALQAAFAPPADMAKLMALAVVCGGICLAILIFKRDLRPYSSPPTRLDWGIAAAGVVVVGALLAFVLSSAIRWWITQTLNP